MQHKNNKTGQYSCAMSTSYLPLVTHCLAKNHSHNYLKMSEYFISRNQRSSSHLLLFEYGCMRCVGACLDECISLVVWEGLRLYRAQIWRERSIRQMRQDLRIFTAFLPMSLAPCPSWHFQASPCRLLHHHIFTVLSRAEPRNKS